MNAYWTTYDQEFAEEILEKAKQPKKKALHPNPSKRDPVPDKEGNLLYVGSKVYAIYRPATHITGQSRYMNIRKRLPPTLERGVVTKLYAKKVDVFFKQTGDTLRMMADKVIKV